MLNVVLIDTNIITMYPIQSLLIVSNNFYNEKRAKRSGRNPATGAFVAMSRSGVVDLNHCINFGGQNLCVHIADKSGYAKLSGSITPDLAGVNEILVYELVINSTTNEPERLKITDAYGQIIYIEVDEIDSEYIGFILNGGYLYLYEDDSNTVMFTKNGTAYKVLQHYRNAKGDWLFSLEEVDTEDITTMVMIADAFTAVV